MGVTHATTSGNRPPGGLAAAEWDAAHTVTGLALDSHDHDPDYAPISHSHVDGDLPTGLARDTEVTDLMTTHEAAADPHALYVLEAAVPGGELGGTYATPTVDATHSGSTHAAAQAAAEATAASALSTHAGAADPHTGYVKENDANWTDLTDGGATTLHSHAGGGSDARFTTKALTSDQADITGTTLVEITGLTVASLVAGTYAFRYLVIYQTTATTTGVEFVVDHTGTDSAFVSNAMFGSTGGAAATGIADQVGVGTAAGLMEVKTQRTSGSRPGVTIGVDTINANCLMIIEGVIVTTNTGDLKLMMAAELAALVCRAKAGSSLILTKTSA